MQTGTRRASGIATETGSVVGDGTVLLKAVGGRHAEAVVGVVGAWCCGGGDSVEVQILAVVNRASGWSGSRIRK